ncbi:MAG: phosphoglycerate kinase [Patescibacteria group bacterium]|jgi:phosphoglycerate kinase
MKPLPRNINLKGKTVLVRLDINSPIKNKKIQYNERITESINTIKLLKKHGAKVICIAHQSSPGKKDYTTLKQHAEIINKKTKITYIKSTTDTKKIKVLRSKEAVLLENIRSNSDEFTPKRKNNSILDTFLPLIDVYINDAFSTSHRKHTSVIGFKGKVPNYQGPTFQKELQLAKIASKIKNKIYILGGNKPDDLLEIVNNNKTILGGTISLLALKKQNIKLGKKDKLLEEYKPIIKKMILTNSIIPIDLAISQNKKRKEINVEELPTQYDILDIGEKTIAKIKQSISKAKLLIIKGPLGKIEDPEFQKGTKEIFTHIKRTKTRTIIAGGHSGNILKKMKLLSPNITIALSGGAFLYYQIHKTVPALE